PLIIRIAGAAGRAGADGDRHRLGQNADVGSDRAGPGKQTIDIEINFAVRLITDTDEVMPGGRIDRPDTAQGDLSVACGITNEEAELPTGEVEGELFGTGTRSSGQDAVVALSYNRAISCSLGSTV